MLSAGSIIINTQGWACISLCTMHMLNIEIGDLFEFGIDLDEDPVQMRNIFFLKVNPNDPAKMEEQSMLLKLRRHKGNARGFYIAPLLKLMNVKPPFVCEFATGDKTGYNFSMTLPASKSFALNGNLISKLVEHKP